MDFDRKKLKPMWAQFWASHQVSRPTQQLSNQTATSESINSPSLAPTPCKPDYHVTQSCKLPTLPPSYPPDSYPPTLLPPPLPPSHPPTLLPPPLPPSLQAQHFISLRYVTLAFIFTCVSLLQRFFKYLCIAAKVPEAIQLAKKALEDGKVLLPPLHLNMCIAMMIVKHEQEICVYQSLNCFFLPACSVRALVLVVWWL